MATLQAIELVKHMSDVRLCVGRCRMEGTQFGACWHPRARALVVMLAPSPTLAACPPSACPAAKHGAPVAPRRTLGDPFGQEPARRVSGQGCPDGARSAGNRGGACAWTCPRCTSSPSATAACPLRSDPLGQEEELQWVRPWSEEERRIFADKFLQYSKDFAKIALYLPARSVQEVVRHYYTTQRSDEFAQTRRKYLLRKRREQVGRDAAARGSMWAGCVGRGGRCCSAPAPPPTRTHSHTLTPLLLCPCAVRPSPSSADRVQPAPAPVHGHDHDHPRDDGHRRRGRRQPGARGERVCTRGGAPVILQDAHCCDPRPPAPPLHAQRSGRSRSRGVLTSAASAPALMAIAAQPVHPAPPARGGTGKRRARRPAAAVKPPYADLGACESQRQSPAAHACLARSLGAHALAVQATRWHGARASRWGLRLWTRTARRAWTTRRAAATPPGCRLPALLGARAAHPTPPATTASARLSGAWLTAAAW